MQLLLKGNKETHSHSWPPKNHTGKVSETVHQRLRWREEERRGKDKSHNQNANPAYCTFHFFHQRASISVSKKRIKRMRYFLNCLYLSQKNFNVPKHRWNCCLFPKAVTGFYDFLYKTCLPPALFRSVGTVKFESNAKHQLLFVSLMRNSSQAGLYKY